jgi:hypothetical protein
MPELQSMLLKKVSSGLSVAEYRKSNAYQRDQKSETGETDADIRNIHFPLKQRKLFADVGSWQYCRSFRERFVRTATDLPASEFIKAAREAKGSECLLSPTHELVFGLGH